MYENADSSPTWDSEVFHSGSCKYSRMVYLELPLATRPFPARKRETCGPAKVVACRPEKDCQDLEIGKSFPFRGSFLEERSTVSLAQRGGHGLVTRPRSQIVALCQILAVGCWYVGE